MTLVEILVESDQSEWYPIMTCKILVEKGTACLQGSLRTQEAVV